MHELPTRSAREGVFFGPMNRCRSLHEVGFRSLKGKNQSGGQRNDNDYVRRHLRSRKLGENLKPPYPNGWTGIYDLRAWALSILGTSKTSACVFNKRTIKFASIVLDSVLWDLCTYYPLKGRRFSSLKLINSGVQDLQMLYLQDNSAAHLPVLLYYL